MKPELRFEILGPQRAWQDGHELELGPGKQRGVLAVLLLHAGAPVATAQIVDAVWQEDPPDNGPNVVQKYVAGLRRVLEPDRSPRAPGQLLTLTDTGYLLRVAPGCLDADLFDQGVRRAQVARAEARLADAAADLRAALALWRGEPFAGISGPVFDAARTRLIERRAAALEAWAEIEMRLGHHRELVADLVELTAEFPLREPLRAALMLALYRSGRQAEALAAFRDLRAMLAEEFGIEPGAGLQDLHRQILRSDPALAPPAPPPTAALVDSASAEPASVDSASVGSASAEPGPVKPASIDPASGTPGPVGIIPVAPVPPPAVDPARAAIRDLPDLADRRTHNEPLGGLLSSLPQLGPVPALPPAVPHAVAGRRWVAWLGTILGLAVALASFGILTWAVILCYAGRRRSPWLGVATAGYIALIALVIVALENTDLAVLSVLDVVGTLAWAAAWLGGAAHIVLLNEHLGGLLHRRRSGRRLPAEMAQRVRREQAKYLLYHYPAARTELRIGRPDLPRSYDDGGLVDVNAVAAEVIEALPGLAPHESRHIVVERQVRGPFASLEDLTGRCLLPLPSAHALRDTLLFLPPVPAPYGPELHLPASSGPKPPAPDPTGSVPPATVLRQPAAPFIPTQSDASEATPDQA